MVPSRIWLRSPRFDLALQIGPLVAIAPALLIYTAWGMARASSLLPLATLIAIPFLHVFGSFFFAFSARRNRSASSPLRLALYFGLWAAASFALRDVAPRGLATFALIYGAWHILRQNFGFLRELAARGGLAGDRRLRRLDLAACFAPAVAMWLLVSARGPWRFIGAEVYHVAVPPWLLALAVVAVPATWLLRERALAGRSRSAPAGLLLLVGNGVALLGPVLFLDDLTLIYTLSASYHGLQYLAYLAAREREAHPTEDPNRVLLPMLSTIVLSMIAWSLALAGFMFVLSPAAADEALLVAWYAIVPFHYFVDGRIWRPAARATAPATATATAAG